jgi:hypothetical protein
LQKPSVLQAAAPRSAHWLSGSAPFATLVQVPSVPASAQDLQVPVQAAEQQIPCAQTLLAQSPAAVQVAPLGRLVQAPPEQTLGATQSVSTVQVVRQAPVPQTYGEQDEVATVRQVPVPLQLRPGVKVEPLQVAEAQDVPAAYSRQLAAPSQNPSVPQLFAPASAHWPIGSCPDGTFTQLPSVPAMAQDRQVPVQVVAQQMPWAQTFELHSVSARQEAPIGALPQLMPVQTLGVAQSAVVPQVVRQAPEPQA